MPQAMSVHRRTNPMMTARPVKVSPQMKRSRQIRINRMTTKAGLKTIIPIRPNRRRER